MPKPKRLTADEIQAKIDRGIEEGIAVATKEMKADLTKKKPLKKVEQYVDPSWKPTGETGWNEVIGKAVNAGVKKSLEAFKKQQEDQKKEYDKMNKGFDKQFEDMRAGGKTITKEDEKAVFKLASELKTTNLKKVHELYSSQKKDEPADTGRSLSDRGSLIGSSEGGGDGGGKKPPKYADIKGKSMDDLVEEEFPDN